MNTIIDRINSGQFVLIAELGVNYYDIAEKMHISPLDAAKLMVKEAAEAGIHAVKFQSYKAETLAAKCSPSYWDLNENPVTSQRELFKLFDSFGAAEYQELKQYSDDVGIEFLSTAFDLEAADYLEPLMNVYKVSSSDLSNLPFIEYQAKKNKPILLSVGASNESEIDAAVDVIRRNNQCLLVLLHCVLEYPTPYSETNLRKIVSLKHHYPDCIIGYSDHTKPLPGCDVVKTAYLLGAQVIEKHFTLDKSLPGNDHFHAMDPTDAREILKGIEFVEQLCGKGDLKCLESELLSRQNARRSLVSACVIPAGTKITNEMLTAKRPGTGISPVERPRVVGRTAVRDIDEDVTLTYDMLDTLS